MAVTPTDTAQTGKRPSGGDVIFFGLYLRNIAANLFSFAAIVLLNVGDEIEAVFGVPIEQPGHADRAVRAAMEMRKSLDKLNDQRAGQGKPPLRHGIGICTGQVLAGITGSENRQSYTLIGSTVNLASRIEELTKTVGCDILISQETKRGLTHAFPLQEEKPQTVKGYSKPVKVYRLL